MSDDPFKLSEEVLAKLTSEEAGRVSQKLSTIYVRLLRAPRHLWEGDDVLRLKGEVRGGVNLSAWEQLVELTQVSPRTAKKVVSWLHKEGVISLYTSEDKGEIIIAFEGIKGSARRR